MAERRDGAFEMSLQLGSEAARANTSTKGIDGICPALKLAMLASMRSASKRTATSNSNPAVTAAPAEGVCAAANSSRPVSRSTPNVPGAHSRPSTAARTVPETGFLISRR